MKKIIICAMLLIIASVTFSQQTNPSPTLTKPDYLQKSKNQKKTARIMLGGGATLILTGIIFPKGEITREGCYFCPEYKNDGIRAALYFIGTLSMLGSIPFFIASLSLKNEPVPQINKSGLVYRSIPSLTLTFELWK